MNAETPLTSQTCGSCRQPHASSACGACKTPLCRRCRRTLDSSAFSLESVVEPIFQHAYYCTGCFESLIVPKLEAYERTVAAAKEIAFWPKAYRGHIPVLKKGRTQVSVENRRDRDDVLLQLGFLTARLGFNAMIQGELKSIKVRDHGYQKTLWSGRALPVEVDTSKIRDDDY